MGNGIIQWESELFFGSRSFLAAMHLFPEKNAGGHSGNTDPKSYCTQCDGLKIRDSQCTAEIEKYDRDGQVMKYTMSHIPAIFVVYGPRKSQSGMSVEGKSCRYHASKKDNGRYKQHCKKFPVTIGKRKDSHL